MKLILKLNCDCEYVARNKMKFCADIVNKLTTPADTLVLHVRKTPAKGYTKINVNRSPHSLMNMWSWKIVGVFDTCFPQVFSGVGIDNYLRATFAKQANPFEGVLYFKFSKK